MTITQRVRERQFDELMQVPSNAMRHGVVPNLRKALSAFQAVSVALTGDYSDMANRYTESIAPIADDIGPLIAKGQEWLAMIEAAGTKYAADADAGAVHPNGLFGTYEPSEDE